jgi:hypothetical protein
MISGQGSSFESHGFGIFVWAAYLCLDLRRKSKAFDGSMLMGVIFYFFLFLCIDYVRMMSMSSSWMPHEYENL